MKKIELKHIIWIILITIIVYKAYAYVDEYLIIKNYQYGEKYNDFRRKNGIPIIDKKMEPFKMPEDNFWGMIWVNENITSKQKPLINKIKIIEASKESGWESESDNFRYFLNDSTDYILQTDSKKTANKIISEYKFGITNNIKEKLKVLTKTEYDSIKIQWKIE
ncbi:hypothetical protein HNQ02_003756 [Flavobacterium sp. 7E]|uniref:hypothetical protein n=1 Tax=Flavobacterium sp. 7E TaxID=2735898 RepID=UPI00156E7B9F|nr:hypothetical protein [Flavobacterium sp. 7E]NRS90809.1 hypothetical protein [Flavobacterium sp. 7E]